MAYAWSEIHAGDKMVKTGDEVNAGDLGLSVEEFQVLVDGGSVREQKYPVPEGVTDQSPTEYYKAQLAALAEGGESAAAATVEEAAPKEASEARK